ncbi:hypothetical protein BGW39_000429 [Mortierella sp. 14UC]|nr:hypothetical protein BGW39_000429 [Mortierella sp. 14UC]
MTTQPSTSVQKAVNSKPVQHTTPKVMPAQPTTPVQKAGKSKSVLHTTPKVMPAQPTASVQKAVKSKPVQHTSPKVTPAQPSTSVQKAVKSKPVQHTTPKVVPAQPTTPVQKAGKSKSVLHTTPKVMPAQPTASVQKAVKSKPVQHTTPKVMPIQPSTSVRKAADSMPVPRTASKVMPAQPNISVRKAVNPKIFQHNSPTYPSPAVSVTGGSHSAGPTSKTLTTVARKARRNKTQPARKIPVYTFREEVDGLYLHASVTGEIGGRYPYDQYIKTDGELRTTAVTVAGIFKCYNKYCKRKEKDEVVPRVWDSYGICVKIWMSSSDHGYRTILHFQQCNKCRKYIKPEVEKDDYVTKIVTVMDRWTKQKSDVKPRKFYPPTGPHQSDKCSACQKGVCPLGPKN